MDDRKKYPYGKHARIDQNTPLDWDDELDDDELDDYELDDDELEDEDEFENGDEREDNEHEDGELEGDDLEDDELESDESEDCKPEVEDGQEDEPEDAEADDDEFVGEDELGDGEREDDYSEDAELEGEGSASDGQEDESDIEAASEPVDVFDQAVEALRAGEPIIFPTDTIYGLGVAVEHAASPQVLYDLKQRDADKPIAWLVDGPDALDRYGSDVPDEAHQLAEEHWPGALTIIVKANDLVPAEYRSSTGTIGLRMPDNDTALALIKAAGSPIAATSANVSGDEDTACADAIDEALLEEVGAVIQDNTAGEGLASTVLDCSQGAVAVLRQGSVRYDVGAREDAAVVDKMGDTTAADEAEDVTFSVEADNEAIADEADDAVVADGADGAAVVDEADDAAFADTAEDAAVGGDANGIAVADGAEEAPAIDEADDGAIADEEIADEAPDGETSDGETSDGETSDGETSDDEVSDDQAVSELPAPSDPTVAMMPVVLDSGQEPDQVSDTGLDQESDRESDQVAGQESDQAACQESDLVASQEFDQEAGQEPDQEPNRAPNKELDQEPDQEPDQTTDTATDQVTGSADDAAPSDPTVAIPPIDSESSEAADAPDVPTDDDASAGQESDYDADAVSDQPEDPTDAAPGDPTVAIPPVDPESSEASDALDADDADAAIAGSLRSVDDSGLDVFPAVDLGVDDALADDSDFDGQVSGDDDTADSASDDASTDWANKPVTFYPIEASHYGADVPFPDVKPVPQYGEMQYDEAYYDEAHLDEMEQTMADQVFTVPIEYASKDGDTIINAKIWTSAEFGSSEQEGTETPKGIIQIVHGMAEYIDRYDDLASYFVSRGFIVCAEDHIGHGLSAPGPEEYGNMPVDGGKDILIADVHTLRRLVGELYPDVPYIMYGHSMGSFIVRAYIARYGEGLAACVLSGTGNVPANMSRLGNTLARLLARMHGGNHRSKLIDNMGAGAYGKQIPNARTPLDWLSTDEAVVDAYIADDLCGFMFTVGGYATLLDLTAEVVTPECAAEVPKDLPVFFVAGDGDPVGDMGAGVRAAAQLLRDAGVKRVDEKIYPGMRHEIHNEIGKEQVYDDLATWIEQAV